MDKNLAYAQWFKLFLTLLSLYIRAVPIAAQPDFISIDCGANGKPRTDENEIEWTSDDNYNGHSSVLRQPNLITELRTLRYFNESRSKFCYELPVKMDKTYLIRAGFLWNNFANDSDSDSIVFNVTVMSTSWTTVKVGKKFADGVTVPLTKEVIVRSTSSVVNVCLVRETGFPFINSLELRPLDDDMYTEVNTGKPKVLVSQWRFTGSPTPIRYRDDAHDRIWHHYNDSWSVNSVKIETLVNQTEIIPMKSFNRPPVAVMKDAWMASSSLEMRFQIDENTGKSGEYYIALYFQELLVPGAASRSFNVSLNGNLLGVIETTTEGSGLINVTTITGSWANITLQTTGSSNPILNAAEIYEVLEANSSTTHSEDVAALNAIRDRFYLVAWTGDPCFPVPWDWLSCNVDRPSRVTQIKLVNFSLGGSIPIQFDNLTDLTDLWLDQNSLKGRIPSFSRLHKLKTLHLRNNHLEGPIPSELSQLQDLQELFLDNNSLSGTVPSRLLSLARDRNLTFTFSGNSLCMPGNKTCDGDTAPSRSAKFGTQLILATVGGTVLLAVSIVLAYVAIFRLYCGRKAKDARGQNPEGNFSQGLETKQARPYTYQEVQQITSNFNRVLGSGFFGEVYHGQLPDRQEVAVKVKAVKSNQGAAEFATEVILFSRVHHKYLVSLVGYCQESHQQILIYVYMANGSLGDYLHGNKSKAPLSWKKRLDIALNAAQGLQYLHNFSSPPVIHRDIKPNNILLDENMVAKLADFGMSKSEEEVVKGNMGYLDPEYFSGVQRMNVKSDVYSFGVVLLELISGQKPTTVQILSDGTELQLVKKAHLVIGTEDLSAFVDPAIGSGYNVEAMWKVLQMGLSSVQSQGTDRPDMGQVVQELLEAAQIEKKTGITITNTRVGNRIPKSVTFGDVVTDSTVVPLKTHSTESMGTWVSEEGE